MLRLLTLTTVLALAVGGLVGQAAQAQHSKYGTGLTQIRYANAYCESGGNPHNTNNWKYRGKWQFDVGTWNAYQPGGYHWDGVNGHHGDPAYAPEWVQDQAALRVTYDAWPRC